MCSKVWNTASIDSLPKICFNIHSDRLLSCTLYLASCSRWPGDLLQGRQWDSTACWHQREGSWRHDQCQAASPGELNWAPCEVPGWAEALHSTKGKTQKHNPHNPCRPIGLYFGCEDPWLRSEAAARPKHAGLRTNRKDDKMKRSSMESVYSNNSEAMIRPRILQTIRILTIAQSDLLPERNTV